METVTDKLGRTKWICRNCNPPCELKMVENIMKYSNPFQCPIGKLEGAKWRKK
jgi:rubrerythrin